MLYNPVFYVFSNSFTESVICFQCADSKFLGDCQSNMKKFENSVLTFLRENGTIGGDHDRGYLKNCTSEWGEYCVIEHYTERSMYSSNSRINYLSV